MRISAPPFLHPCYYGTDIDSEEHLIACRHSAEETAKILGADSLGYLPLPSLVSLAGGCGYCSACFDGSYPTAVPKDTRKDRFEQKAIGKRRTRYKTVCKTERKLVLEDGQEYVGFGFGDACDRVCELVFNTSMVGYQEILSDPSYTNQAVVMTYPLIGNYGMAADDYETDIPSVGAFVVREYNDSPSNFRSQASLAEVMRRFHIPGICGVDTRKLTRSIRDYGTRRALLTDASTPTAKALRILKDTPVPHDAVSRVSCREIRTQETPEAAFHVVAVDCGMKKNIVRSLLARGCRITAVPWNTPASGHRSL